MAVSKHASSDRTGLQAILHSMPLPPNFMKQMTSIKTRTAITAGFLLFVAITNIKSIYYLDQIYSAFITNDWLINYEGGFIRRGLAGQLLLHAASISHLPLWIPVFSLRALLYMAIAVLTAWKLVGRLSLTSWIFLLSPVTFLFEVYDPGGAGRKELLFILLLAANSMALEKKAQQHSPLGPRYYAIIASALAIGILVHESFLFYVPLVLLQLAAYGRLRESRLLALPLAAALFAFALVSVHKGSASAAEQILHSLSPFVPGIACDTNGGAICYLSSTTERALRDVFVPEVGQLSLIPLLILLAYSAVFLNSFTGSGSAARTVRDQRAIGLLLVAALISIVPLFLVAVDYGRWVHVFVTALFFSLPRDILLRPAGAADQPNASVAWLLAVIFSLSWSIVHTRAATFNPGAIGILASRYNIPARVAPPSADTLTRFGAPGTSVRWKGCELPSAIGKPAADCGMLKGDPKLSGFLTYGPYERLPAGEYALEILYSSPSAEAEAPGAWDAVISLQGGSELLAKGTLSGSNGARRKVSATFAVDASQALHPVEIRTTADSGQALQVDYIQLERLR
jgi:hypothetical protein